MNNRVIGFALASLVLLPGCLHVPTYKAKPLKDIDDNFTYHAVKNGVVFQAKCLTHGEMYYLFGERTKQLLESVEVIYCSIHNISSRDYVLLVQNEGFSSLDVHKVRRLMETNSGKRLATGLGGGVATSLATYGVVAISGLMIMVSSISFPAHFYWNIFFLLVLGPPVAFIIGFLPFLGKGIKSMIMNGRISKDLKEKMLHDDELIKSGAMRQGLIFVRAADYVPQFSITLHEKKNSKNKIVFDVNMAPGAEVLSHSA